MIWVVEILNEIVDDEQAELLVDTQTRFARISPLMEAAALPRVHEPHIKHAQGALWEIWMQGRDGIARAITVASRPWRVVVVPVLVKKTAKTPRQEITLAQKLAR